MSRSLATLIVLVSSVITHLNNIDFGKIRNTTLEILRIFKSSIKKHLHILDYIRLIFYEAIIWTKYKSKRPTGSIFVYDSLLYEKGWQVVKIDSVQYVTWLLLRLKLCILCVRVSTRELSPQQYISFKRGARFNPWQLIHP